MNKDYARELDTTSFTDEYGDTITMYYTVEITDTLKESCQIFRLAAEFQQIKSPCLTI